MAKRTFRAGPTAALLWLVLPFVACDDAVQPVRDLQFCYFIHPGSLDAGTPGQLRAAAYVGPNGCWHLGGASLQQDGNRLRLSGYAIGESDPVLCTQALVFTTLTLDIPPLASGTYVLEAGDLVDTLLVGSPAPRPAGKSFAARGRVFDWGECTRFGSPGNCPLAAEISGILAPFLIPPHFPPKPWDVLLAGTVVGVDHCAGTELPSLVVRSLKLEEVPQP